MGWKVAVVVGAATLAGCSTSSSEPPDAGRGCGDAAPQVYADAAGVNAGSCCRPVVAVDVAAPCSHPQPLPGICFHETRPHDTSGTGMVVLLVAPSGRCFQAFKGFTECLQGDGWTSDPFGKGGGWSVWGGQGFCESDTAVTGADGKPLPGPSCAPPPPDAGLATCR